MRPGIAVGLLLLAVVPAQQQYCPAVPPKAASDIVLNFPKMKCVLLSVVPGESVQLQVEQPFDLKLAVTGPSVGPLQIMDEFEFGLEILTLSIPGDYRVELLPAKSVRPVAFTISMFRRTLPLQEGEIFFDAEFLATKARMSGKREDLQEALDRWRETGDRSAIGRTLLALGDADVAGSHLVDARAEYQEAADTCNQQGDARCATEAEGNVAFCAQRLGDLQTALSMLPRVVEKWRLLQMPVPEGQTLSNLGWVHYQAGQFGPAISALKMAKVLLAGQRELSAQSKAEDILALCHMALLDFDAAYAGFSEALATVDKTDYFTQATIQLSRGILRLRQGRLPEAEDFIARAMAAGEKHPSITLRAQLLGAKGSILMAKGDLEGAQKALAEGLDNATKAGNPREIGNLLHQSGLNAMRRKDAGGARKLLAKAAETRGKLGLRDAASESLLELARAEMAAGDRPSALVSAQRALSTIQSVRADVPSPEMRAAYYARKRAVFDTLVDLAMADRQDRGARGLLAAEQGRSRALMDLLTQGPLASPETRALATTKAGIDTEIAYVSSQLERPRPELKAELTAKLQGLLDRSESLRDDLEREAARLDAGGTSKSVSDIAAHGLDADTMLFEYHLGESASYRWALRHDGRLESEQLPPRKELEALANKFVELLNDPDGRARSEKARAEFEQLRKRLSTLLLGNMAGANLPGHLIFALDGALNRVPVAALRGPEGGYLGLERDLGETPSGTFLVSGVKPRGAASFPRDILAFADPVYSTEDERVDARPASMPAAGDRSLQQLFFATELKALERIVPANRMTVLKGFQAAPAALRSMPVDQYAFLYFSTHSIINERDPEKSRIVLSLVADRTGTPLDGNLHPAELARLPLKGSTVVLSTCESALGKMVDGEGLAGFTQSFFAAGAAQLVMSLAKVDALAAAKFFTTFYSSEVGGRPQTVEHALRLARTRLAGDPEFGDPYYWGSFFVVGRPVLSNRNGKGLQ